MASKDVEDAIKEGIQEGRLDPGEDADRLRQLVELCEAMLGPNEYRQACAIGESLDSVCHQYGHMGMTERAVAAALGFSVGKLYAQNPELVSVFERCQKAQQDYSENRARLARAKEN